MWIPCLLYAASAFALAHGRDDYDDEVYVQPEQIHLSLGGETRFHIENKEQ